MLDSFVVNVTCVWLINAGWPHLSSLHCNTTTSLYNCICACKQAHHMREQRGKTSLVKLMGASLRINFKVPRRKGWGA